MKTLTELTEDEKNQLDVFHSSLASNPPPTTLETHAIMAEYRALVQELADLSENPFTESADKYAGEIRLVKKYVALSVIQRAHALLKATA